MQKLTPNPDRTIRSVCASMKMEGFQVSKQTQEECRAILSGQKSADDICIKDRKSPLMKP